MANAILGFLFVGLLSHTLVVGTAGALFEAIAIFTICSNATELGADTGLLRLMTIYRRRHPSDLRRLTLVAFVPAFVCSSIAAFLVILYAPQLTHVFVHKAPHADTPTDLRILAAFLAAQTTETVLATGIRSWSIKPFISIIYFFVPLSRIVLLGIVYAIGLTPRLAAVAWAAPIGVAFVMVVVMTEVYLRRESHRRPPPAHGQAHDPPSSYRSIARKFWTFSLPRSLGGLFQILIVWFGILLVGAYTSAHDAAAYTVASRYLIVGTFPVLAVGFAIAPQIVRLMDGRDRAEARNLYSVSTWWVMAASWPILLSLAIFAPFFTALFGHKYQIADTALVILSLSTLANTGTGCNGMVLLMAGRSGVNLAMAGIGLAINVGLGVLLIPHLGLTGAAIGWTATILFSAAFASTLLWKLYRISPFGPGYPRIAAAAILCYAVPGLVLRLAFGARPLTFAAFAVVSSVLYAGALWFWRRDFHLDAFSSLVVRIRPGAQSAAAVVREADPVA